jgi:hypothetical protein
MPTSAAALLILVIAIVPGALGNVVFTRLVGTDWREKELSTVVRVLAISVFGLALYAWIAVNLGCHPNDSTKSLFSLPALT